MKFSIFYKNIFNHVSYGQSNKMKFSIFYKNIFNHVSYGQSKSFLKYIEIIHNILYNEVKEGNL